MTELNPGGGIELAELVRKPLEVLGIGAVHLNGVDAGFELSHDGGIDLRLGAQNLSFSFGKDCVDIRFAPKYTDYGKLFRQQRFTLEMIQRW